MNSVQRVPATPNNDDEFMMQIRGYRLATAEIIYRMPDHPSLLQTFVWQQYDIAPNYPVLHRFLEFWRKNLDGELFSVRVASVEIMSTAEIRVQKGNFLLH